MAKNHDFKYMECSAKSGESVNEVFGALAKMMKEKILDTSEMRDSKGGEPINPPVSGHKRCCPN